MTDVMADYDVAGDIDHLRDLKATRDPRTITQMKAEDQNFTEGIVVEAHPMKDDDGYVVEWEEVVEGSFDPMRVGVGIPKERNPKGIEPQPGQQIRVYGRFGHPVYGMDVGGEEIYWLTPWERFSERIAMLAAMDRDRREEFEREREKMDRRFEELPPPMKARIERFRREDPMFRIESEGYEMAACYDAPKIAKALAAEQGWTLNENVRVVGGITDKQLREADSANAVIEGVVREFYDASYEEQRRRVPDLDEGHSGNTFGHAVQFAYALLAGKEL